MSNIVDTVKAVLVEARSIVDTVKAVLVEARSIVDTVKAVLVEARRGQCVLRWNTGNVSGLAWIWRNL
jgi:hypothetical protein